MRSHYLQQKICRNLKGTIRDKEDTQGRIQLQIQVTMKAIEQHISNIHLGIAIYYYLTQRYGFCILCSPVQES